MPKKPVKASAKKQATPPVKRSAKSSKQAERDHPTSSAPEEEQPPPVEHASQLSPGVTIDPPSSKSGDKHVIYVTAEGKHVPCCASHVKATPPEQRTDRARLVARHDPNVLVKDWVAYAADKTPNTWHYPDAT